MIFMRQILNEYLKKEQEERSEYNNILYLS